MIRNKTLAFALAGVFAVGGAGIAYAQTDPGSMGMMGAMGMMADCPMTGAMSGGPEAALGQRDALELTPEQAARLESLRDEAAAARTESMTAMRDLHRDIEAATAGESFDEAAARDAFGRMGDLHAQMGLAMSRTRHEARQVLTPEQRETLTELSSSRSGMAGMERMGGMMQMMEMMRSCPMMQGRVQPDSGQSPGGGAPDGMGAR